MEEAIHQDVDRGRAITHPGREGPRRFSEETIDEWQAADQTFEMAGYLQSTWLCTAVGTVRPRQAIRVLNGPEHSIR